MNQNKRYYFDILRTPRPLFSGGARLLCNYIYFTHFYPPRRAVRAPPLNSTEKGFHMAFHKDKLIRFAHCDPAGIGFYPRYVELINEVVEDWFGQGLGVSFREFHEQHGLGLPTVRLEVEYMRPSRYGDVLDFRLEVMRIGRSSMTLAVSAWAEGNMRLRAELTVVLTAMATLSAVPIDGDWRSRFERFLATTPE